VCAVGLWDQAPRHAAGGGRPRTEAGRRTAGPGPGPGPGAEAGRQRALSAPGSGQIRPVRPGADDGPGSGPGARCVTGEP